MTSFIKKHRKNRIDWTCGASTILFYLCIMWLIVMAVILFVQLSLAFTGASKSQLYSDILADGSAYIGNNGWGLDKDDAKDAYTTLAYLNSEKLTDAFEDVTEKTIKYAYTNSDGEEVKNTANDANTVVSDATWKSTMISDSGTTLKQENGSATKITYTGGMKIVLEAWHHTYQYGKSKGYSDAECRALQSSYVWGGGHNGDDEEWKRYADCSGFVTGVYRECGYNVPECATGQLEHTGVTIADGSDLSVLENAMPGDVLVFWYPRYGTADNASSHTAIYAGYYDGYYWMVHCSGNEQNNPDTAHAGNGEFNGALLAKIYPGTYSRIKVQRIVDSNAEAAEVPDNKISGMTEDESTVYWALKEFGYSDSAAAALLGCMHGEGMGYSFRIQNNYGSTPSSEEQEFLDIIDRGYVYGDKTYDYNWFVYEFSQRTLSPGTTGYGMAQWTVPERKTNLWNHSIDGDVSNVNAQIRTLIYELETCFPGLDSYLRSLPDNVSRATLDNAVYQCQLKFEGIMDSSLDDRQGFAWGFYQNIQRYG